ncbi:hypothetical protein [Paraburkholderia sp. CI3]|uniref:hypothetical protein n=1 Tax=Paraburkholderia sp. CI3 TaxID=2991060 RepID=UPI003D1EDCD4
MEAIPEIAHAPALLDPGVSRDDITNYASGGAEPVLRAALIQSGFTHGAVAYMARGGDEALRAVLTHGPMLLGAGVSRDEIPDYALSGAAAVRAAASGGPRAPAVARRISQTDTRTPEEIARTANLHRRGLQRGLDDLPAMWQSLGQTVGTEEQQQRARTFVSRLQGVEGALRRQDWGALRDAAHANPG